VIPAAKAAAPLLDDKGNVTGAVGAFWDLSREKAAELSRERFLLLVAHELRSPLTGLLSALQLFERPGISRDRRALMWHEIRDNATRLRKFADDFLDHEASIRSPQPVRLETLPIAGLTRELVRQFKGQGRGHRFRVRSSKPEPIASVDVDRFKTVLRNLLDNAVNYSPPGSLVTVMIRLLNDKTVEVAVQDQGEGIPREDRERVFEPFYRSPQLVERRTYGHGLGLSIAKGQVKEMGGEIWVDGRKDHGSTFHITLRRPE
jgi:signal transduction histidine kinase